jgi:hypothetical protein
MIAAVDNCLKSDSGARTSQYMPGFRAQGITCAWEEWEVTERGKAPETTIALVVRDRNGAVLQPASKSMRPKTTLSLMANVSVFADPADKMEYSRDKGYAPTSAKSSVILSHSEHNTLGNKTLATLRTLLTDDLVDATVKLTKNLKPKHHAPSEEQLVTDAAKFTAVLSDPGDDRWALPVQPATDDEPTPKMTFGRKLLTKSYKGAPPDESWNMFGDSADWVRANAADHTPQALKVLLSDGKTYVPPEMLKEVKRDATALVEVVFQGWYLNNRNKSKPQHTIVSWVNMIQLFSNGMDSSGSSRGVDLEAAMAEAANAAAVISDETHNIAVPRKADTETPSHKTTKKRRI